MRTRPPGGRSAATRDQSAGAPQGRPAARNPGAGAAQNESAGPKPSGTPEGGPTTGRSVTIMDVARRARVSKTTASDALSGSGRVSAATRARIEAAAAELGYVPNSAARHLRRGKVGTIGLYIPRQVMGLPFYMEFAFAAARRAQEHETDLTLLAPAPRAAGAPRLRADGLITIDPMPDDPVTATLLTADIPIVTVGGHRSPVAAPIGVVRGDYRGSMHRLLDHLAEAGATVPAHIATDATFQSEWAVLTRTAYEQWCDHHCVEPCVRTVAPDATPDTIGQVVRDLLADHPATDALVCAPDGTAICALNTLHSLGRRVGDDILLAACVDNASLQLCDPPITAIDLHPRDYGTVSVDLLVDFLTGAEQPPLTRPHAIDLRIRPSTSAHGR